MRLDGVGPLRAPDAGGPDIGKPQLCRLLRRSVVPSGRYARAHRRRYALIPLVPSAFLGDAQRNIGAAAKFVLSTSVSGEPATRSEGRRQSGRAHPGPSLPGRTTVGIPSAWQRSRRWDPMWPAVPLERAVCAVIVLHFGPTRFSQRD